MKKPDPGAGSIAYGESDDRVEIEGQLKEEFCSTSMVSARFSDGTILDFTYGGTGYGTWKIKIVAAGSLLIRVARCGNDDENSTSPDVYSDVAVFDEGLTDVVYMNRNIE